MVQQCEDFIKGKLVAPATYKRASLTIGIPDEKAGRQSLFIQYDAANSYGVPIRSIQQCDFPYGPEDRKIRPVTDIERNVVAQDSRENAAADAEMNAMNAQLGIEPNEPDCCMPPPKIVAPVKPPETPAAPAAAPAVQSEATSEESADSEASEETAVAEPPPNLCWQDYCPCDPPQGGPDKGICRQLRAGMHVDEQILAAAAMMRDAREQMDEFNETN